MILQSIQINLISQTSVDWVNLAKIFITYTNADTESNFYM